MKTQYLIIIPFLIFQSCKKSTVKDQKKEIETEKIEVLTSASETEQREDTVKTITFKGNLANIASANYGNKAYYLPLAKYNNLKDGYYIKQKTQIQIPTFSQMVKDTVLGMSSSVQPEVDLILQARALYQKHEKSLWKLNNKTNTAVISKNTNKDLNTAITLLNKAITALGQVENAPKKMIGQLKSVSKNLQNIANGKIDENGYDLDMVHQRLAHAFKNGIVWSREITPN